MAAAAVVVDLLDQCLHMGDLHHAVKGRAMSAGDVRAELAEVIAAARPGRGNAEEIVIFDSTGRGASGCRQRRARLRTRCSLGAGVAFQLAG